MSSAPISTSPWPGDLYDFAFIPAMDEKLAELAKLAEEETWSYQHTKSDHPLPILFNYVRHTYRRVAEENKIALSDEGQYACFNTGLVTSNQEPLFALFEAMRKEGARPWCFKSWLRRGQCGLIKFSQLPDIARSFDDPTCLVFDTRKDFRVNIERVIEQTPRDRFPEPYASMQNFALQTVLKGAIDNGRERVRRSYKTAIPQYYKGRIQLLLPLCLSKPQTADLALIVERHPTFYQALKCLTLDMAYNNARQIARPDRDWLQTVRYLQREII